MQNPDCSKCDLAANVLDDDSKIGLFEGARYYQCGLYRPAYSCRMGVVTMANFCAVCVQIIGDKLSTYGCGPEPDGIVSVPDFDAVLWVPLSGGREINFLTQQIRPAPVPGPEPIDYARRLVALVTERFSQSGFGLEGQAKLLRALIDAAEEHLANPAGPEEQEA